MWRRVTHALNLEIPEVFQESSFMGHTGEGGSQRTAGAWFSGC